MVCSQASWRCRPKCSRTTGKKFKNEDGGVEHDAPGNFEHDGMVIPHDDGMPDAERPAEIEDQGGDEHGIAEEGGEDHGAENGAIRFEIEDVDDGSEGETASGEGDGEKFEADPETPRKFVVEIGGLAEAVSEAVDQGVQAGDQDQNENRFPESDLGNFHGHEVLNPFWLSRRRALLSQLRRQPLRCGDW